MLLVLHRPWGNKFTLLFDKEDFSISNFYFFTDVSFYYQPRITIEKP